MLIGNEINLLGTTQILFSTEAYQSYQNATGAVFDPDTQSLKITSDQYENLESIYVKADGVCVFLSWVWSLGVTTSLTRFPSHSN